MCDEPETVEDITKHPDYNPQRWEQYFVILGTGKPAFRPPGTPWWRLLLDRIW